MTTLILIASLGLALVCGYRLMSMLDRFLSSGKGVDKGPSKQWIASFRRRKKRKPSKPVRERAWIEKPTMKHDFG